MFFIFSILRNLQLNNLKFTKSIKIFQKILIKNSLKKIRKVFSI